MKKIKLGLIYGGKSGEHEVSCRSAESIYQKLDKSKYLVTKILIDKSGKFDFELFKKQDVFFPIIHGTFGEDGSLQGMLEMLDKPYVGAGVLGSAVGMDKEVMKKLFVVADIPHTNNLNGNPVSYPVFVKPASLGSSVGVSKADNKKELDKAIKKTFRFDTKIIMEEMVEGREIEVAVMGNEKLEVSLPGEVIPKDRFYSYEEKYDENSQTELVIPAKLSKKQIKEVQDLAKKAYKALYCEGMARVDMFMKKDGSLVINEINTLPGFTSISMFPKLFEVSGIPYSKLLDRLVELAFERKARMDKLERSI